MAKKKKGCFIVYFRALGDNGSGDGEIGYTTKEGKYPKSKDLHDFIRYSMERNGVTVTSLQVTNIVKVKKKELKRYFAQ